MTAPCPFELELLEPRVLLSATPVPVAAPSGGGTANSSVDQNAVDHSQRTATESSNAQGTTMNVFEGVAKADLAPDHPGAPAETQSSAAQAPSDAGIAVSASQPIPVMFASDLLDATSITEQLTETLNAANGPPTDSGQVHALASAIKRPLLLVPGISGSFPIDLGNNKNAWYTTLGLPPVRNGQATMQIDPVAGFYNDIIATLEEVGYRDHDTAEGNQNLFLATYDWRLSPGPSPADNSKIDGKIDDVTADSLHASLQNGATPTGTYKYGVDYLAYWMGEAIAKWNSDASHANNPAKDVDIIAHSMGGVVTRVYLQSAAYNKAADLPAVHDLFMVGVPERGASKAWNIVNDNWASDIAYQVGLSGVVNTAYKIINNSTTAFIRTPYGPDITGANLVSPTDQRARHLDFIAKYLPGASALMPTYDFLADNPASPTTLANINAGARAGFRNSLVLDLNDGLDLFYKTTDLNASKAYTYTAPGTTTIRDPNRFIPALTGDVVLIYTDVGTTPTTVLKQTGTPFSAVIGLVPTLGSIAEFDRLKARGPNSGEVWYQDQDQNVAGDGTVPTTSAVGSLLFGNNVANSKIKPTRITETGDYQVLDHTGLVGSAQVQRTILQNLDGVVFTEQQISAGKTFSKLTQALNLIKLLNLSPSDADAVAALLGIPNWENVGPTFIQKGNVKTDDGKNFVEGAIQAIAISPHDASLALAGSVNGGIWRTTRFQDRDPEWIPVTDNLKGVSITTIVFSNVLPNVVYAATGNTSSTREGLSLGLLYSSDNGQSWTPFASDIRGRTVTALLPTGVSAEAGSTVTSPGDEVLMISLKSLSTTTTAGKPVTYSGGVYLSERQTDRQDQSGEKDRITAIGDLPEGDATDLAMAPGNVAYVGIAGEGVFRGSQNGANLWNLWTDTHLPWRGIAPQRIRFGVYNDGTSSNFVLYAADAEGATDGELAGLYRLGAEWHTLLGSGGGTLSPPLPTNNIFFSIAVDTSDRNHIFMGGKGQNIIEGTLKLQGDPGKAADWVWDYLTASDANGTIPHADSRQMLFRQLVNKSPTGTLDGNGLSLVEADDGGIYVLPHADSASSAKGKWTSKNGDLSVSEIRSVAYDNQNHIILAGLQDNGAVVLTDATGADYQWSRIAQGDGEAQDVVIDPITHIATYYSVQNNFNSLFRRDVPNGKSATTATQEQLQLSTVEGGRAFQSGLNSLDTKKGTKGLIHIQLVANPFDPRRVVIGYYGLYESFTQGDSIKRLDGLPDIVTALAVGGMENGKPNADVIYAARGDDLYVRDASGKDPQKVGTVKEAIVDIVLDPGDWRTAYFVTQHSVYKIRIDGTSPNLTAKITNITGDLKDPNLQTIELVRVGGSNLLLVGGSNGVSRAWDPRDSRTGWSPVGAGLPRVQVTDLKYDPKDKILLAATFGRGIWMIQDAPVVLAEGDVWLIYGTPGNDQIVVNRSAVDPTRLQASVNGKPLPEVPLAGVSRIEIQGRGGSNDLVLDLGNGLISVPDGIEYDGGPGSNNTWSMNGPAPSSLPAPTASGTVRIVDGSQIQYFDFKNATRKNFVPGPRSNVLRVVQTALRNVGNSALGAQTISQANKTLGPFDNLALNVFNGPTGPLKPISDPDDAESEEADDSAAFDLAGSILDRLTQSNDGSFLLDAIGDTIATTDQLRAALDALDSINNNVTVSETAAATRFDVHIKRSLSTETEVSINTTLSGGAIQVEGELEISADIDVHLVFGVDDQGFFIQPNADSDPELIISNLKVDGSVDGSGRFGFLGITLSDATLSADPDLKVSVKLHDVGDNTTSNVLRLEDLVYFDPALLTLSVQGNPNVDDLAVNGTFSVGPVGDDDEPAFTLLDTEVELRWADINNPTGVKIEARTATGSALLNFLTLNPSEIVNQIDQYRQFLETFKGSELFKTPLPFAGGKTIGDLVDFGSGLVDLVKKLAPGDDQTPAFSTLQELVGSLDDILGLPEGTTKIAYDFATKSFTFGLNVKATLLNLEIPFDFGTNIGPIADLSTDGTAKVTADLALSLTLGFDTRQLGATLRAGGAAPTNGRLSGDAHFALGVGASQPVNIVVQADPTNQSINDLVVDINAALSSAQLGDKVRAGQDAGTITFSMTGFGLSPYLSLTTKDTDKAATDLKFAATQTASGSVADLFFIQEGAITGTLKLAIENANAQAKFGDFIDVDIVNAKGEADVSLGVQFKDFGLNQDGRITFGELLDNITSPSKFAKVTFNGSAHVKLPVEVNPNILGDPSAGQAAITIDWPDFTDPNTLKFTTENFEAIADLQHFSFERLFSALQSLSDYLSKIEGLDFLSKKLPLVNKSITELLGTARQFAAALEGLNDPDKAPKSLQFVATTLEQLLNLPSGSITLSLPVNNELKLSLLFTKNFTAHQDIDLDLAALVNSLPASDPAHGFLGALTDIVQVDGTGQLDLDLGAKLQLDLGWDLTPDPANNGLPDLIPFLYDTSNLSFTAKAAATHINFTTALGPLSIGIKEGSAQITEDCAPNQTNPAKFEVGLNHTANGRYLLSQLDLSAARVEVKAGACANLPIFVGNESTQVGAIVFTINSLPDFFTGKPNSLVITLPDFSKFLDNFNFFDHLDLIVDGIDYVLSQVQAGLDSGVFSLDLPIVGDGLAKAADQGVHFIEDIRQNILAKLKPALAGGLTKSVSVVRDALFQALGPAGLNLIADQSGDGQIKVDDIQTPIVPNESVQFNLILRKPVTVFKSAVNFDIGIPLLGLKVDGAVDISLNFEVALRFGVSRSAGFYLDTSQKDEIKVGLKASTPNLKAQGRLGFMVLSAADDTTDPSHVEVAFAIDIKKPNLNATGPAKDRLTFDDILRAQNIEDIFAATLSGSAAVRLNLLSTFAGDDKANFPSIRAKFRLDWSLTSENGFDLQAPQIAFNDVELNLGEFVNKFAIPILAKIQEVLGPMKPILDFLATRIPVISDIKGSTYSIGDMLLDSGGVKDSTKNFIHQAHHLLDLFLAMKDIGKMTDFWFPLGSFSFNQDVRNHDPKSNIKQTETLPSADQRIVTDAPSEISKFIVETKNLDDQGGGFKFPIFDDPKILFGLLMGKDVPLVEYTMPQVDFKIAFEYAYPIYGYLMVFFRGAFGGKVNLSFGYDTHGLREFIDTKQGVDLLSGFYVKGGAGTDAPPLFSFFANISVGVKVEYAGANVGISGGFQGDFNINLNDPNKDGKVHVDEFIENLTAAGDLSKKLLCTFQFTGKITFGLTLFVTAGPVRYELNFAQVPLFQFDSNAINGCDDFVPDRFDKVLDSNGTRSSATDIGVGPGQHLTDLNIGLGSDIDYYKFELVRPDSVDVKALFRNGAGGIGFQVSDANKKLLGKSDKTSDGAALSLHDLKPGIYYIQVRGPKRGQLYDLAIVPGTASGTHVYYVNDSSKADQYYALAAGDDANDGLSSDTPKATVQAVLDEYELQGTDIIAIDTGQYLTSTTVSAADGQVLYAGTPGKTVFNFTQPSFNIAGSGGNIFYRLNFQSTSATAVAIVLTSSGATPPVGNQIRKNSFNGGGGALRADAGDTLIEDNTVTGTNVTALLLSAAATGEFHRNQISVKAGKGIQVEGAGASELLNNTIKNTTTGGILLLNQASGTLKDNEVDAVSGDGIAVLGPGDSLLQNNTIYATTDTAFRLGSGKYTLKLNTVNAFGGTGIRVEGPGTLDAQTNAMGGLSLIGIHLRAATSSKLLGNRLGVTNPTGQGILAEVGAHQIESNIITGGGRGIRLLAAATLSQPLLSNTVNLAQGAGIELDATQAVEITSNTVANASTYGIYLPASTGATLRNNQVALVGGEGIHLDAGSNILDSNIVTGLGNIGIWLTPGASGPITNNSVKVQNLTYGIRYDSTLPADIEKNASGTAHTFGIYISNAATSKILSNNVDLAGNGIGIRFEKGTGEITDNTITGTGDYGIYLTSTVKVSQGAIRRNHILNAANQAGLRLDSADPVTIEDNVVKGPKVYGIFLPASVNSTLRNNNVVTGYGGTPIRIEAGTVLIESNTLKTDSSNGYGIDLAKTAFGTIRKNTLTGGGMRVEFGENLIESNNISGSRNGYNIHLNGTASGTIRGNTLPDAGIEVNGPVKVVIENNDITTPGAGVSIRTATEGRLTGNHINNSGTGFELLSGLYDIENNVIGFNAEEGIYLQERSTLRITGTHIIRGNIIQGVKGSVGNSGMLVQSGELLIESNVVEGALDGIKAGAHTSAVIRGNHVLAHNRGITVLNSGQQLVENNTVAGVDNSRSLGDGIEMEFISPKTSSIVRHNDVSGFLHGINSLIGVQVYDNMIHDNITGTWGSGTVGRPDGVTPNQIYNNTTGSNVFNGGILWFNRIYDNKVGIEIGVAGSAFHNEVFRSSDIGVHIGDARDAFLWNNTIVGSTSAALSITGASNRLIIRNNILSYTIGYGVFVDVTIIGTNSSVIDYNLFNPGAGAKIGSWNKTDCPTLGNWQAAASRDANSLVANPRFTNVAAGDFSLQAGSPAIDRGDAWYGARRDAVDGGRVDDPATPNAGRVDYVARDLGQSLFTATGTARNFRGNSTNWGFNLPWSFPIYDQQAAFVTISSEGTIGFLNSLLTKDPDNSTPKLIANYLVAPLWDNLRTDGVGDDIFIDTSLADQVKIRWNATNEADNTDVQFSITLFKDGHMRFDYGPGNTSLSPTIGTSIGNNAGYTIAPNDGSKTLTSAHSIELTLRPSYVDIGAKEYGAVTLNNGQVQRSNVSSFSVNFAQNVLTSLTVDDFLLRNQTTGATIPASSLGLQYDNGTNRATLTFTNGRLADGNYDLTVLAAGITGPTGSVLDADLHYTFRALAGDANGDGVVNDRDLLQVFQDVARPVALRSLNNDVNGDGQVNNADLDFVRAHYLTPASNSALAERTRTANWR